MNRRIKLTAVLTHPIQYYSPWFRFIAEEAPELDLSVLYASEPDPGQQGVGFESTFLWDVPLREGYRNVVLRAPSAGSRFESDAFWGLDVPEIGEAIGRSGPDVVLLSGWHSITLLRAIAFCRRRSIPLLYRGDTQLAGRGRGPATWPWRLRTGWLLRRFDRFLCVGRRAREYLRRFGIRERAMFASPHAVDNEFFARSSAPFRTPDGRERVRREWNLTGRDHVVLFAGKLEAKKRPMDLIEALATASRTCTLVVAGTGALEAQCRRRASELGLEVRWLGFLNQTQIGKAYGAADCLVLPSDWGETWGLVVNEAMACGVPCIVSDRAGCAPDLIEEGRTGFTYPCGDVPALERALARLRELRRDGKLPDENCRDKVREHSYQRATEGLLAACRSLGDEFSDRGYHY